MTDIPILFKRTEDPGPVYGGLPDRDLTHADWDRLDPRQRRDVKASALYAAAGSDEALDPLGELDNAAFEALSPQEKGARTRKANQAKEDAEAAEAERLKAVEEAETIRLTEIERLRAEQAADEAGDDAGEQDGE